MSNRFRVHVEELVESPEETPVAATPEGEQGSVETAKDPQEKQAKPETELVVYCKVTYFEGLKEAIKKERHDQYEIKSSQEVSGNKGCVRVRKTTDSDGVKFVLTNKVRTENENLSVAEEFNLDITEEQFEMFTKIAPSKTIKDRFIFSVKNITVNKYGDESVQIEVPELKFEVDVFPKEDGGYHDWCKIDIEIDPLLEVVNQSGKDINEFNLNIKVNHLPFKPVESFVGSEATDDQKKILDMFYQEIFFVKM
jgi:hypothetical protein